ncbi:hypothetical protein J6A34_00025, partial [bacterium]|nr:hypothetical protein [bacterium]
MSKLTRKYGKTMSAFAVATLAGITSMGMAQAQSPEVIMAPIPQVSNEYGTGDSSINFDVKEYMGVDVVIDANSSNLWKENVIPELEYALSQGWLPQEYYDINILSDTNKPSIKYNYTLDNFTDNSTFVHFETEEITADYVNEVQDIFVGSGIGIDMTIGAWGNAVIGNSSNIENIDALFLNTTNLSYGGSGGFIAPVNIINYDNATIGTLKADFVGNGAASVLNRGSIDKYTGNVLANSTQHFVTILKNGYGMPYGLQNSAVPQFMNLGEIKEGIINSNFVNNVRDTVIGDEQYRDIADKDVVVLGNSYSTITNIYDSPYFFTSTPAIYTTGDLTIGAEDSFISHYAGNKSKVSVYDRYDENGNWLDYSGKKEDLTLVEESNDAIFIIPDNPDEKLDLTLQAKTGGKLVMEDKINGVNYNLKVTGDETGAVYLNDKVNSLEYDKDNDIITALDGGVVDVSLEKTNLILGRGADVLDGHNLTLNSGALSMLNGEVGQMSLNQLNVAGDTKFYGDVDLANAQMDRVTAGEYSGDADIVVAGLNLLSDAKTDTTEILFADYELKDNVRSDVTTTENNLYQSTAYSPIFKYDVKYSEKEDGGYFEFSKHVAPQGGGSAPGTPSVESFNPAVLGSSTSATVGATATMNQTMNYAFQHSSDHMNIPYLERVSMRDRNKYALSITGDATDMGRFSPLYQPSD